MDIEFKGGAMVTVGYQGDVDLNNVKQTVAAELGQSNLTVQTGTDVSGAQTLTINLPGSETLSTEQLDSMIETLNTTYPDNQFVQQEVSNVNPTIGNEFLAKSVVAVVAACVLILVYVAVRFRRIGGWSAGAMAIVALLHDMFVVYGVFVLLRIPSTATLLQLCLPFWATPSTIPLLSMTVSARTPAFTAKKMSLPELVNLSINQSFGRSMMTSITTCIALAIVCVVSIIFKLTASSPLRCRCCLAWSAVFTAPCVLQPSCGSAIRPARLPPPPRKRKPGGTLLCVARTAVPMNPR